MVSKHEINGVNQSSLTRKIINAIKNWFLKLKNCFTYQQQPLPPEPSPQAEPPQDVNHIDDESGAFALKVERQLMDYQKCDDQTDRFIWQIALKNSRNVAQRVLLEEKLPGEGRILRSSHQYKKDDDRTILFDVIARPSAAQGDTIITYEVEVIQQKN